MQREREINLPKHFKEKMREKLGDEYPLFIEAEQQKPGVSIRINPDKGNGLFAEEEQVPWCRYGRYLQKRPAFVWDPLYHAGAYYAQEASSMLFANFIDFSQPLKVLDLCAAPGGKSSLLLSFLSKDSLLVSNEMVGKRASILYENLVKWGCANNIITSNRSSDFKPFQGYFDVVLIDAPCSGEGMFRKDQGAIEQWSEGLVAQCSIVQREILKDAVQLVKPGGLLIYSTCTFEEAENENNLEWLHSEYGDKLEPQELNYDPAWGLKEVTIKLKGGSVQKGYYCFPHRVKGEGLFISAMQVTQNSMSRNLGSNSRTLQLLNKQDTETAIPYLKPDANLKLYKFNDTIHALPASLGADAGLFADRLRIKKIGTAIGQLNKKILIPDHETAMDQLVSDSIPRVNLTKEQALDYMQKKPVTVPEDLKTGWFMFTYEGIDIGWAKNIGNRVNNHYPSEWRIRKEPVLE
jgi:16S rRNA C967 or C1407 C5-methylase (RsmB/RsmF family)/NOL1/NOP2/fmu family ribosome biogenesis protein